MFQSVLVTRTRPRRETAARPDHQPLRSNQPSRWRSDREWLIGAAFVPLMFFAGIMILIETKKGRLVIESDVAGLNATLLRDGEFYEELKLEPGTNSTTLLAGQYKIVIDGATDVSLLDGGKIEIKRGEVVVARVRSETKPQEIEATASAEPIFEGKPLGYWLDIVVREREHISLRNALNALKALRSNENAVVITSHLLQAMRGFRAELYLSRVMIQPGNERTGAQYSPSIERTAFELLWDVNPGPGYYRVLADELKSGELRWQQRIVETGLVVNSPRDWNDLAAVIDWMESRVFVDNGAEKLLQICAAYYWDRVNDPNVNDEQHAKFLTTLARTKSLDLKFWLGSDRLTSVAQGYSSWRSRLSSTGALELEKRAVQALSDENTDPQYQAHAAIFLQLLASRGDTETSVLSSGEVVAEVILAKLLSLVQSRHNLFSLSPVQVSLSRAKYQWASRSPEIGHGILKPSGDERQNQKFVLDLGGERTILAMELLQLLQVMNATEEFAPELMKIYMATSELNEQLNNLLDEHPTPQVTMPTLEVSPELPISKEQWIAGLVRFRAFSLMSQNTRSELTALAQRTHGQKLLDAMLATYDSDANGELSVKEAAAISNAASNYDRSGDGKLDASEFSEFMRKDGTLAKQPIRQVRNVEAADLDWAVKQIAKYDKNRDQQLTVDEWSSMFIKPDGADANGDGAISAKEYATFRSKKK